MPQEEMYGTRNSSYSVWHRRLSTQRFVGIENAQRLAMIDIDAELWVEYSDEDKEPLAIIETAVDVGQEIKPTTVMRRLAMRCTPPLFAYVLLYTPSLEANPCAPEHKDISQFRYRRVWPQPDVQWKIATPCEWAELLLSLRTWSAKVVDKDMVGAAA